MKDVEAIFSVWDFILLLSRGKKQTSGEIKPIGIGFVIEPMRLEAQLAKCPEESIMDVGMSMRVQWITPNNCFHFFSNGFVAIMRAKVYEPQNITSGGNIRRGSIFNPASDTSRFTSSADIYGFHPSYFFVE